MSITIDDHLLDSSPVRELDLEAGDALEALIVPRLAPGMMLSIDLSDVSFADSSGLGALIAIEQAATEQGAHLRLTAPSPHLQALLKLTGLTDFFVIDEG